MPPTQTNTLTHTPLIPKTTTLAWNAEKHVIGRNGVHKAISQTKMTTEVNSIYFSGLNNSSSIPSTLTKILES